ncbi:hypothetical protein ACPC54_18455 [Kitasatospora sp. NPDC094028]
MPSTTPAHQLIVPTAEGGDLVFVHFPGAGIGVWTRGIGRRLDEKPRPGRRAAPLYGGGIPHGGWVAMAEFFTVHSDDVGEMPAYALSVPPIVDTQPIKVRCGHGPEDRTNRALFTAITFSPLHMVLPWSGPAPELLLSYARKGHYYPQAPGRYVAPDSPVRGGFFATGLPELPASAEPGQVALGGTAVIPDDRVASVAASLLRAVCGPQPDDDPSAAPVA